MILCDSFLPKSSRSFLVYSRNDHLRSAPKAGVVSGLRRLFSVDEANVNSEAIKARLITTSLTAIIVLAYLIGTLGVEMAVDSFLGPASLPRLR